MEMCAPPAPVRPLTSNGSPALVWQTSMPDKYRRWQEMEIKHGRIAMLATLHVITTGAGYKWSETYKNDPWQVPP